MKDQATRADFRVGHATAKDWRRAVDQCLEQVRPLPPGANIAFIYFTDHFADQAEDVLAAIKTATGIAACVGTAGMGVCATGVEYFDVPAVALMVGSVPAGAFTLFDDLKRRPRGWFGVVHADPRTPALAETLADLGEATGAYLVGGLTASRGAEPQFAGGLASGISGVVFSEDVAVVTGLTQGCAPIGPAHRVTACQGNVALELDGRPPFAVLRDEAGEAVAGDLRRLGDSIMVGLPVSGADRPDYMVRHLVGVDPEDGPIAVAALLEEGQRLMFCRRGREPAQQDLDRMLHDLKRRAAPATPRGAVYFTCTGRGPNLFGRGDHELKRIAEVIGDVPVVGFSCAGEISNSRLYGYTGVLSLFL